MTDSNQAPVHRISHGRIEAAIWVNQSTAGAFYNVTVKKSYQDKNGEWHDGQSFSELDLPTLSKAVLDAHTWIATKKAAAA